VGLQPDPAKRRPDCSIRKTPVTAELTIYAILLFIPLGLISGVIAGARKNKIADYGFRLTAYIATTLPSFILALLLMSFFYCGPALVRAFQSQCHGYSANQF